MDHADVHDKEDAKEQKWEKIGRKKRCKKKFLSYWIAFKSHRVLLIVSQRGMPVNQPAVARF